jgi:hypothetical protein
MGGPANEKGLPTVVDLLRNDPNPAIRHACTLVLYNVLDHTKHGIVEALTAQLQETDPRIALLRYEAARVLAFHLRERTPDRARDLVLECLKRTDLQLYTGATTQSAGTGESRGNEKTVSDATSGSARFLAAEAFGWMGKKADTPEILSELDKASKDKDEKLAKYAKEALRLIKR